MIAAVIPMPMVQMPCNQIVGMISMWNCFLCLMVARADHRNTTCRITFVDGKHMLLVAILLGRVQMAFVEVIDVPS